MGSGDAFRRTSQGAIIADSLYAPLMPAGQNANRNLIRSTTHLSHSPRPKDRRGDTEIKMFIFKWSKRLIETLQCINAKCTEATEMHGRYCISDAKIRTRR
jgi:hypothetical protein